ncbi:MAG TPA: S41 family peptidase [Capillibacterium sp.]
MTLRIKPPVNRWIPLVLILLLLAAFFGLGFAAVQGKYGDLVLAGQIIPLLKARYYRPLRLSQLLVTYWRTGSVPALLASLKDPYTRYLTPDEYQELLAENKGVYGGVGLYLEYKEGRLVIYKVIKNSPAAQAGLQPGDRIIAINGQATAGMTKESVAAAILGPPGTTVFLTVQQGEGTRQTTREITLNRTLIDPSLEWEIRPDPEAGKIGWLTLTQFTEETGADLGRTLELFRSQQVAGVILDLRYNPGGLLVSALEVASRLLPGAEGKPLVFLEYRNQKQETFPAWTSPHPSFPLVVLVNEWSASSAEIVAAAIKDLKAGVLVGNTTFGKGLVQDVIPLRGGGALYFTVARYLTAGGYSIHQTGVEPDLRVTLPASPAAPARSDPALLQQVDALQAAAALQVLKELIRARRPDAA